jgi:hypothetical protein
MAPNPTTPLRGATPDWDSNSLDSSQAVQIVKVATTYGGWSAGSRPKQRGIERRNSRLWQNLGCCGVIGWEAGIL